VHIATQRARGSRLPTIASIRHPSSPIACRCMNDRRLEIATSIRQRIP